MISKYFFILVSFFVLLNSYSQNEEEENLNFKSLETEFSRPKTIFKLALLSQLDFNSPSLQLGLEIKVSEIIGIHQELGYVNNWLNPFYTLLDHETSKRKKLKNGLKYIVDARFYPFNKNKAFASRMFFAPSFDFRYVVIQRKEWITINNAFQQNIQYNVQRLAYGMHAKFGFTMKVKKKMPIDVAVGLGARYITLTNTLPENAVINSGQNVFFVSRPAIEGRFWMPSVYIGMLLHLPILKK